MSRHGNEEFFPGIGLPTACFEVTGSSVFDQRTRVELQFIGTNARVQKALKILDIGLGVAPYSHPMGVN